MINTGFKWYSNSGQLFSDSLGILSDSYVHPVSNPGLAQKKCLGKGCFELNFRKQNASKLQITNISAFKITVPAHGPALGIR